MDKRGLLIVLSGPSGVGKGTVRQYFMEIGELNLTYSISMTTRKPRNGEQDGRDYFFVSKDYFHDAIQRGELLEHAEFVGNCYGTPASYVEKLRQEGKNVLLEIEVQGMIQIKEKCSDALTIFIVPPSMEELEQRIRGRRSEDEHLIAKRLKKAENEMNLQDQYKYVICNDDPMRAAKQIEMIIRQAMSEQK